MANVNPIHFTLSDNTIVIVKKVTSDKYDFELFLTGGSRKTFLWHNGDSGVYTDKKGNIDQLILESIKRFKEL